MDQMDRMDVMDGEEIFYRRNELSGLRLGPFNLLSRKGKMVRLAGLEPARVAPLPPQSSVSANSTISAAEGVN